MSFLMIGGLLLLVPGFFGVRWFCTIFTGKRVSSSVIEPIVAFYLMAMGVVGVLTVIAALRG